MSVSTQKNVMAVLVGGDVAGTAIATLITNSATQDVTTYLPEGQIIALGSTVTGSEVPMETASTSVPAKYPSIRLAVKNDGVVNYSPRIFASDVLYFHQKGYVAPAEQISYVGYNGTTNSIDATGTDFMLTFVGDWDWAMWAEQKYRKVYDWYSNTATQQTVAQNFSFLFNMDQNKQASAGTGVMAKVEVLNSGTAADWTSAGTVAVVNGSDVVTLSATSANAQLVGAILRLGSTGSGVGTTIPVYIVTGIPSTDSTLTSTQVRVHTPFQGTTAAALDATSGDAGIVTAGSDWGLKFTGKALTFGLPPFSDFKYEKVSFHIELKGFGTTVISESTRATKGTGTASVVKEFEYFASGNEGALNRTVIPLPIGRTYTTGTNSAVTDYNTMAMEIANKQKASEITAPVPMRQQIFLFIPDTSNGDTMSGLLATQIDSWFAACNTETPVTF